MTLSWDNGEGLRFETVYTIDEDYLFTVTQRVTNGSGEPLTALPYGLISRTDTPEITGFYILHEGPLGVFNDTLKELDYDDLVEAGSIPGILGIVSRRIRASKSRSRWRASSRAGFGGSQAYEPYGAHNPATKRTFLRKFNGSFWKKS